FLAATLASLARGKHNGHAQPRTEPGDCDGVALVSSDAYGVYAQSEVADLQHGSLDSFNPVSLSRRIDEFDPRCSAFGLSVRVLQIQREGTETLGVGSRQCGDQCQCEHR